MNKCMCNAGENSLSVSVLLPGVQNGKPTPFTRYWGFAKLLLGINRNEGSWCKSLSDPSCPMPLPFPLLIFQAVKAKRE